MKKLNISSETFGLISVVGGFILMCVGAAFMPAPEYTPDTSKSDDDFDVDDLIENMKPSTGRYSWEGCCMGDAARREAIDSLVDRVNYFDLDSNKMDNVKGIFVIAQDGNQKTRAYAIKAINKISENLSFTSNKKTCRDYIVKLATD